MKLSWIAIWDNFNVTIKDEIKTKIKEMGSCRLKTGDPQLRGSSQLETREGSHLITSYLISFLIRLSRRRVWCIWLSFPFIPPLSPPGWAREGCGAHGVGRHFERHLGFVGEVRGKTALEASRRFVSRKGEFLLQTMNCRSICLLLLETIICRSQKNVFV